MFILFIATSAVIYAGGLSILNSYVRNVSAELQYKRKDTVSILQYLIVLALSALLKRKFLVHFLEDGTYAFKELKKREDRLKELNYYLKEGLITRQVFDEKIMEIVKEI